MMLEEKRMRDWYYRNAVSAFREYLQNNLKTKDFPVYADTLLRACEENADIAAEFIEMKSDRLRYINHNRDKKGKLIGFDVVFDNDKRWLERKCGK